jgi:hypothetical protein
MARLIGAELWSVVNLAAPTRTSFTVRPGMAARARLTRRTHEPQCIPSILSVTAGTFALSRVYLMIAGVVRFVSGPRYETLPRLRLGRKVF